jgi:hypothetical protein
MGAHTGAKRSQDCGKATAEGVRATGGRRRANGVNFDPVHSIYKGSTGSACCGSFRHTTRFNGSIPGNSREDCAGFIDNRLSHNLNSEFRSSAINILSLGHPDDKQVQQAPTSH